jgi:hypothetical protein
MFENPFTAQTGGKYDPLLGSSDPTANLSHIPLDEPWVKPSMLESGAKIGSKALLPIAIGLDVLDVASAPPGKRVDTPVNARQRMSD